MLSEPVSTTDALAVDEAAALLEASARRLLRTRSSIALVTEGR